MDLTRVSVVLAALNVGGCPAGRARLLPAQADLVMVDNGPTDNTAAGCRRRPGRRVEP